MFMISSRFTSVADTHTHTQSEKSRPVFWFPFRQHIFQQRVGCAQIICAISARWRARFPPSIIAMASSCRCCGCFALSCGEGTRGIGPPVLRNVNRNVPVVKGAIQAGRVKPSWRKRVSAPRGGNAPLATTPGRPLTVGANMLSPSEGLWGLLQ